MKVKVMIKVKAKTCKEAKELVTKLLNQAQRFDDDACNREGRKSLFQSWGWPKEFNK